MDDNQDIVYISRDTTQCPNCFGQIENKDKKRGTFFCLYCGQRLAIGATAEPQPNNPVREQEAHVPTQSASATFEGQNMSAGATGDSGQVQTNYVSNSGFNKPVPGKIKTGPLEILSVVLGALSIFVCCCYGSGIVFGALSILFAVLDIRKRKNLNSSQSALDMFGLILGIIGTVLSLIMVIWLIGAGITGGSTPMDTIRGGETTEKTTAGMPSSAGITNTPEPSVSGKTTVSSENKSEKDSEPKNSKPEESIAENDPSKTAEINESEKKPKEKPSETENASEDAEEKEESEKKEASVDQNEIRPEIKEAIDSYEAFMDEYIDFMNKYSTSNSTELLMEYMDWMSKYADMIDKMDKLEGDLTDAEAKYYAEVMAKISGKMLQYSISQ